MRLKLIRDISMRIYSEAGIAENPLLAAADPKFSFKAKNGFRQSSIDNEYSIFSEFALISFIA